MIVTGADLASSAAAVTLAQARPRMLFATAGVHPHHATTLDAPELSQLRALLADPSVVAVGECGLDYYRNFSPRAAQLQAFEWQLGLALEVGKPVFLHQRAAHAEFMAVLRAHATPALRGVAHCFTGNAAELVLRRATRTASGAARASHTAAPTAARDRRTVLAATRSATAARGPSQRADVPAAHWPGRGGSARRKRRRVCRAHQRARARAVRFVDGSARHASVMKSS